MSLNYYNSQKKIISYSSIIDLKADFNLYLNIWLYRIYKLNIQIKDNDGSSRIMVYKSLTFDRNLYHSSFVGILPICPHSRKRAST